MAGGFKALKGQGHFPTLFMAFLYFDMSFRCNEKNVRLKT
jgi:hypothetical protein